MNRHFAIALSFFGIAACATSGPEVPAPAPQVDTMVTSNEPVAAEGELEFADPPKVTEAENVADQASTPKKPAIVCRKEKRTGSHRVTKICRTRAEIEAEEAASKDAINELKTQQNRNDFPRQSFQRERPRNAGRQ